MLEEALAEAALSTAVTSPLGEGEGETRWFWHLGRDSMQSQKLSQKLSPKVSRKTLHKLGLKI